MRHNPWAEEETITAEMDPLALEAEVTLILEEGPNEPGFRAWQMSSSPTSGGETASIGSALQSKFQTPSRLTTRSRPRGLRSEQAWADCAPFATSACASWRRPAR